MPCISPCELHHISELGEAGSFIHGPGPKPLSTPGSESTQRLPDYFSFAIKLEISNYG